MKNNDNFKILNSSIDGLDIAFLCTVSQNLVEMLEKGKAMAQQQREPALVVLGPGVAVHVCETGGVGGYAFRCDTGPEGETWFFKNSSKEDWNARVSVKSATLARHGWEGVKAKLYAFMEALRIRVVRESIGRVDVAVDIQAPEGFAIDPALMIAHARTSMRAHSDPMAFAQADVKCPLIVWKNHKVQSLTVGKMPGRQVIVYDKSAEIKAKGKSYWWEIWRVKPDTQVWRIEVRAGKKFLKEKLGLSRWEEVEKALPDIIVATLERIRLAAPDLQHRKVVTQRGFHPLWQVALEYLRERWAEVLTGCLPVRVIREERKRMVEIFEQQVTGCLISYANVCSVQRGEFKRFVQALAKRVEALPQQSKAKFSKKWEKSGDKYRFLTGQLAGQTYRYEAA